MSLAIGRQRAREGHSHVTAGRVIVVVPPEGGCEDGGCEENSWKEDGREVGGCEEGSWKEDGLDLFFREGSLAAGGETKGRGGDGDVTVASGRVGAESANSSFVEPP